MSSVTPTEGYNSYYMKHLTELEDELKRDAARTEQHSRERVEDAEGKYREAINTHEERTNDVVEKMQQDHFEANKRSRENERAELEQIRKQTYDRFGRNRINEADTYKQQLNNSIESAEVQHEADQARLKDRDNAHSQEIDRLTKDYGERLDKTVEKAHDSANEAFHNAYESGKTASDEQRLDSLKKYQDLNRNRMEEVAAQRRQTEKVVEDSKRDLDNSKLHSDQSIELRLAKDHSANAKRIDDNFSRAKASHDEETGALRDKLEDLMSAENHYVKEYGQGKSDAVRDYEDTWRSRERVIQETNERDLGKLKSQVQTADERSAHGNERNLHERDVYFADLIAKKSAESRDEQKDLTARYEKNHTELETRMKTDKARSQDLLENLLHDASEQRSVALENQARTYQNTIANQQALDGEEINKLQQDLKTKNTSTNEADITPAVENAVRRSVVKQYEKNLNTETERNKRSVDGIHRAYADRFQNQELEHTKVLTDREQLAQYERHMDQARFLDHVQDTEYQKNDAIRHSQDDHDRETENMNRTFSQANTRQRAEYESILQASKDDAASRITTLRQESEFNAKSATRAFSAKQNELIREYEKKLADQKTDYEGQMDELKSQTQLTLRESERRGKGALEEQARGYEQRLNQGQAQQKERERSIAQNYEDELEKVKRSNALLQQKKS